MMAVSNQGTRGINTDNLTKNKDSELVQREQDPAEVGRHKEGNTGTITHYSLYSGLYLVSSPFYSAVRMYSEHYYTLSAS